MLLGHVDTVIGHDAHQPLRAEGERLYGTGTADMKGGVVLALGRRAGAGRRVPSTFAELAVLLVTDEEWRMAPFVHAPRLRRLRRLPVLRGRRARPPTARRGWSCAARPPGRCG